jgi:hypothetical protein
MSWHRSGIEAAEKAFAHWVRVKSNMPLGAYEIEQAMADLGDPVWPELPFKEILRIAFRDNTISDLNHTIVQQLRGKI